MLTNDIQNQASQILPRDREVGVLEAFTLTIARLVGAGWKADAVAGYILKKMSEERLELFERTFAAMLANPTFRERFANIINQ